MIIENKVFNMREVGDKSIQEIKSECLADFAYNLQSLIWSEENWSYDEHCTVNIADSKSPTFSTLAHYKTYEDTYGTIIKYNSKNIVYEELISNNKVNCDGVQTTCAKHYGLARGTEEECYSYITEQLRCHSRYPNVGCECSAEEVSVNKKEALRNFHLFFGRGEFPYINIHVIRVGNVDHYFYTITR